MSPVRAVFFFQKLQHTVVGYAVIAVNVDFPYKTGQRIEDHHTHKDAEKQDLPPAVAEQKKRDSVFFADLHMRAGFF